MEKEILLTSTEIEDPAAKKIAYIIYFLYLAGIILPVLPVIGIIFAYIFENDAKSLLISHYQFLIRTFWIGLLYFVMASFLVIIVIGWLLLLLGMIWWIIRSVKGLKSLLRQEAIVNPVRWTF